MLRDVMKRFKDLAIWEIKSLTVSLDEVMQGVINDQQQILSI